MAPRRQAGGRARSARKLVFSSSSRARVVAEHDPFEDRAPFSRETGRRGAAQPGAQAVGSAAETAPAADDVPLVDVQDDVDALPAQPGPLVEAVRPARAAARRPRAGSRIAPCGGERPGEQLELHALVQSTPVEAETRDAGTRWLNRPTRASPVTTTRSAPRRADRRQQRAAVERASRTPPHAQPSSQAAAERRRESPDG